MLALEHAEIHTPWQTIPHGTVLVEGERILAVGDSSQIKVPKGTRRMNLEGLLLTPGFIDSHTHGGFGHDFMACTLEEARRMLSGFVRYGVTRVLATIASCPQARCVEILEDLSKLVEQDTSGARLLGFHLEGPYLSAEKAGAQPEGPLRDPDRQEVEELLTASQGAIRLLTLAPELFGAMDLIRYLKKSGVIVSMGHSNADYSTALEAIEAGVTRSTHTFNGMSSFHHRKPGIPGAVLTLDQVYCELIADGHHVHPAAIDLLIKAKGSSKVILISDSNQAVGLGDGAYTRPGGREITVRDGAAWLSNGSLAGSVLTLDQAIRRLVTEHGYPLGDVLAMASSVPAESLKLAEEFGAIRVGSIADLVVLNQDLKVEATLVGGQLVYKSKARQFRLEAN